MIELFRLAWKLWGLRDNKIWYAARRGVNDVMSMHDLHYAAKKEEQLNFCPSCGQIPDGDRRMDHARKIAMGILNGRPVRRFELDAAISLYYFLRKS